VRRSRPKERRDKYVDGWMHISTIGMVDGSIVGYEMWRVR